MTEKTHDASTNPSPEAPPLPKSTDKQYTPLPDSALTTIKNDVGAAFSDRAEKLFKLHKSGLLPQEAMMAALVKAIADDDPEKNKLGTQIELQGRYTVYAWRKEFDPVIDAINKRLADFADSKKQHEKFKKAYEDNCEQKRLSIDQVIVGAYHYIYSDANQARSFIHHMFFDVIPSERIKVHNCAIVGHMEPSLQEALGQRAMQLKVPLFPHAGKLVALNNKIFDDKSLIGGEPLTNGIPPAILARHYGGAPNVFTGGEYYEAIVGPDGQQHSALVMTQTETMFRELAAQNESTSRKLDKLSAQINNAPAKASARVTGYDNNNNNNNKRGKNNGQRGRGGYGRGRGGRGYYGGDLVPEERRIEYYNNSLEPKNGSGLQ